MKINLLIAFGAAFVVLQTPVCLASDAQDMTKTVNGFYTVYSTFHPSDGIPDAKDRAKYAPYLSPALEDLLRRGNEAEQTFAKANKDSPPLIEGDLFTSNFEGATSFKLNSCTFDLKTAQCTVAFVYNDRNENPNDKPVNWTDTVYLAATPEGWRVDDIGYGGNWAFGNKGRLSDTLRSVIMDTSQ